MIRSTAFFVGLAVSLHVWTMPSIKNVDIDPAPARGHPWNTVVDDMYPNAVIVTAHGYSSFGHWFLHAEDGQNILVAQVITTLRVVYPDRRIVLIVCNPGHHVLDASGVTYSMKDVWILPDERVGPDMAIERELDYFDASGGLDEFTHND